MLHAPHERDDGCVLALSRQICDVRAWTICTYIETSSTAERRAVVRWDIQGTQVAFQPPGTAEDTQPLSIS